MIKIKKIGALLLAAIMVFSLTACGNSGEDSEDLLITSVGEVNEVENTVVKVMEAEESESELDIKYAIFTDGNIVLKNSAQVKGDVAAKSVDIGNNAKILGDVDLKPETKYEEFIFPDIPLNDSKEKIEIPNSGRYTINSSASYREIDIKNSGVLTIDASNSDILLNVRKLTVGNSGKVIIKGSNKVTFYLEDTDWNNSSSLTYESRGIDTATVDIYHYGNKKIDLGNRVEVSFNLFIKEADLNLKNSSALRGNVFSNGRKVDVNNSVNYKGLIYAVKANVDIKNSGRVYGAIVANQVELGNSSYIEYNEAYISDLFRWE
ncbi:DUF7305 domain-containing protein [Amphibacillus indicireducens]|uniref:DUF7305 domain-containing protein n=1 Tax=Amphibacillus indicireducens TaxID=1076330 RepID=A0ABP7V001_9BACI